LSSDVVTWVVIWGCHLGGCHLGLSSGVVIWGCHLGCHLGLSSGGCHLGLSSGGLSSGGLSSGVVIWGCHLGCHLGLSSGVVIWRVVVWGLSSGLSSSVVIWYDTFPILFIYWKLYSLSIGANTGAATIFISGSRNWSNIKIMRSATLKLIFFYLQYFFVFTGNYL
jgi:hypothetical protein